MNDATRRPAGELEAAVLAALWAAERPLTPTELQHALPAGLARTTVATILARLHDKGTVHRTRQGRAFTYRPAVEDPAALSARRMHSELDKGTDRTSTLARFISQLSPDDEDLVRALLTASSDPQEPR